MVEEHRDRKGGSVVLMGAEKSQWDQLKVHKGLVDGWKLGDWFSDPWHTYFSVQYQDSFSRLDRVYFGLDAQWISHTLKVGVDSPLYRTI